MSSVYFSVSFGLIISVNLVLKESSGLPIPTTPLPLPPGRFLPQPFDKDGYDYPGKKFPRNWGPPPPELFNPNTFKEQEPRGMIETNNVQPDFGNNYYNSYEPEGYYIEEEHFIEEEETNYDSIYSGESSYETSQMNYVESNSIYGNPYGNTGYPMYMGNDFSNQELEYEPELEAEAELELMLEEDDDYADDDINDMGPMMPPPTQPPPMPPSNGWSIQKPLLPPPPLPPLTQKPLPPPMQQQIQQMQQQAKQMAAASQGQINSLLGDNESGETENKSRSRERFSKPTRSTPSPSVKPIKDIKLLMEEPIVEPVREIELFSRTTTITKTTTWYINSDNELVISEETEIKPSPLKGKYVKTSKTTTSGPVPWYLQGFEDVIFEEENGKSKTILDKMAYLKNMNPTSITSYTTAPNPWSTEVHEEVVFEEVPEKEKKDNQRNEPDLKGHYSHASPLEHIVDYLPRSQLVHEEVVEVIEKVLNDIKEEEIILEEIIEEEILDVVPPHQVSTQPPKPFLYPQQSQEEMFITDYRDYNPPSPDFRDYTPPSPDYRDYTAPNPDYRDYTAPSPEYRDYSPPSPDYREFNSMSPNQITTQKALPPSPVVENSFAPPTPPPPSYPRDPYQAPTTPPPSTLHPTQQPFPSHPQQSNNHPQPPPREQHPSNNRDIPQPRQTVEQPQEPQGPTPRIQQQQQRNDMESQRKLNSQLEAKRQLYQSRQQQQQQLQQQQYPNRPNRQSRDL